MYFHKFFPVIFIFFCYNLRAQNQPQLRTFPKKAEVNVSNIKEDFSPLLQNLELPKPGADSYYNYLLRIKNQINKARQKGQTDPVVLPHLEGGAIKKSGFEVFPQNSGVPNDNDMAISNNGKIVAVQNTNFLVADTSGNTIKNISLAALTLPLGLKQQKYDPRVLYDPETDRFIVAILNGSDDSTSFIVLGFSKTNDPAGDWNLYTLPGNPLNDTTWSDYPIIALNNGELFLTINSLQNNKSWQEGFRRSYIWQIDKNTAYEGKALVAKVHGNNIFAGSFIRNLCPVQGGSKPANGSTYFLSSRNFSTESDSIFMITLNGKIYDNNISLKTKLIRTDKKYGVPPSARQIRDSFQTNDARILDALIENGKIHFVGNSLNSATKLAAVYHGIISNIDDENPGSKLNIISAPNLEFGYPSVAYIGKNEEDAVLIFFNHTSDTVPAGNSAIVYNGGFYSDIIRLKDGTSYVSMMQGRQERWGDYSGAQTRYNQPGKVWVCGYYGYKKNAGGGLIQNLSGTYIAEVENASQIVGSSNMPNPLVYPSPADNFEKITIEFTNAEEQYASFEIFDMQGKRKVVLLEEKVKQGKNRFSFLPANLRPGMYILRVTYQGGQGNAIASTKFMVK